MDGARNGDKTQAQYRLLPAVDALLRAPALLLLAAEVGAENVTEAARAVLAQARATIADGGPAPDAGQLAQWVAAFLHEQEQPSLRPVVNATGVIIHTNLGRAPLSSAALEAVAAVSGGYSTLEYSLERGERGSRHDHARALLCRLTGSEDALIVNNNAAAVYLVLAALCGGREVLISRGQLVEIGGGFRIPDVLRQSGALLVEVGTTNRTHLRDFAGAIGPSTAALMRVHSSNFKQIGFVAMPELGDMAALAQSARAEGRDLILIDDLGSGTLLDTQPYGLAAEPTVQQSIQGGADLVTFSGDKLLGGPQAGLIVGRRVLIERLRSHPMARALRVDKMTLAALEATLRAYARGRAPNEIPVWRMISATADELRARAEGWRDVAGMGASVLPGASAVGGGSLPGETLPTWLLALSVARPDEAAAELRRANPAIVCRIQKDQLLFDPRTVLPQQEEHLLTTLARLVREDVR